MKNKPHICFVAPFLYPVLDDATRMEIVGGAEVQQVLIGTELARRGYPVTMITYDFGQADGVNIKGMTILRTHKPGRGIPVFRFFHPNLSSLWRAMTKADADIYYQRTAAYVTGIVASFTRRRGKKFIFAAAHNTDFMKGKELLSRVRDKRLYRYGLKRADAVIVQNKDQQQRCRRHYRLDSCLIPNAYTKPGRGIPGHVENGAVLWVGTMRPFKRPELFLDLAEKLPEYRFVMAGGADRACPEYYERIKARSETIDNLDFRGFLPLPETETQFDEAAVFVNTSRSEGFPNTFLQAWARSIPTISFFSPFTGDTEGGPGCIVSTAEELLQSVSDMMGSPVRRKGIGETFRSYYLHHFTPAVVIPRYERLVRRLVEDR